MRFADFTYEELRDLAPQVDAVFIPLGCTEQQGPHMTVNFDSLMIERLCDDVASRLADEDVTALVMPTLPFGPTPEHAGFGHGFVNLRQSTHEAIVEDVLESLASQGYQRLLIWRGCGQHELQAVIERFHVRHADVRAYQPVIDYGAVSQAVLGNVAGGHADSFGTSICLLLDEARVRTDRIRKPRNESLDWSNAVDFAKSSDTGVIGDPTHASKEAGADVWRRCVEAGSQAVLSILRGDATRETWRFKEQA